MLVQITIIASLVTLATAQIAVDTREYVNKVGADNYYFKYRTSDGTERFEQGKLENGIWTVTGNFAWTGANGRRYSTEFVADDKGYRILPGRIPEEMLLSLGPGTSAALLGIGK